MVKQITLTTRKQIEIFMSPQRQRILKIMDIYALPMTSKQISVTLGISSSSVTHHLKKLEELGVVELDHTKMINGIEAKYYIHLPTSIDLRSEQHDDLKTERGVLSDYLMNETWKGFKQHLSFIKDTDDSYEVGDASCGIIYLNKEEVIELKKIIHEFYNSHMTPTPDSTPWETAVVYFPRKADDKINV